MKSLDLKRDDKKGSVVQFRPRIPCARNENLRPNHTKRSPVEDVGKYARSSEQVDYHQQTVNNLLAFLVLCLIVYCGTWLANTMAQMRP